MIPVDDLNNSYYIMRHGQSLANVEGIIVSAPENGIHGYGLTETGKKQAADSVKQHPLLDHQTIIYSSDFLRTKQTALIAEGILKSNDRTCFTPHLRERFFGDWELTSSDNYEKVWAQDRCMHEDNMHDVERVTDVLKRALLCVMEIEEKFHGKTILMVSHGDTLQIMSAFFRDWPPHRHREVEHLDVAEIRNIR